MRDQFLRLHGRREFPQVRSGYSLLNVQSDSALNHQTAASYKARRASHQRLLAQQLDLKLLENTLNAVARLNFRECRAHLGFARLEVCEAQEL